MNAFITFAAACHTEFFGFPVWWKYLSHPNCQPQIQNLSDIWLIVAAIIEIALRIAAIVAVVFIIYGGCSYTTSQGDPDGTKSARNTLVNALIGLAVAVMAAVIVSFIARSIN
jgi:ABC-type Fe3+ transport system permease subunit